MKNLILILYFLLPMCNFAQKIVDVKIKKTGEIFETYKKDKSFRDGIYTKFYIYPKWKKKEITGYYSENKKDSIWSYFDWQGNLYKKGRYENGLKNGLWTFHTFNEKHPSSKGIYFNDLKTGIWEYFNENGVLIHKFNHSDNQLLYYTEKQDCFEEQANDLIELTDFKGLVLGGEKSFHSYIGREFRYPKDAQWNGVSGRVFVNFFVDENFKKSDYSITNNPGYGIGKEAKRLIEEGPVFIPPKKDGSYSKVKLSIPINFTLN
ncbi:energy transducer TonB [Maribacter caenipelagi]|nr:energy transducer TonB [Maribacter caenipelagi]